MCFIDFPRGWQRWNWAAENCAGMATCWCRATLFVQYYLEAALTLMFLSLFFVCLRGRWLQLSIEQFQKFRSTVLDVSKVLDSAWCMPDTLCCRLAHTCIGDQLIIVVKKCYNLTTPLITLDTGSSFAASLAIIGALISELKMKVWRLVEFVGRHLQECRLSLNFHRGEAIYWLTQLVEMCVDGLQPQTQIPFIKTWSLLDFNKHPYRCKGVTTNLLAKARPSFNLLCHLYIRT